MLKLEIGKKISCPFGASLIKKIAGETAKLDKRLRGKILIGIIGESEIKNINKKWRGQNRPTDVLSFAWQEDKTFAGGELGEIFLCWPQIKKQAKERGILAKEEFVRILAHGLLHLIGYDHAVKKDEKKMFALQERVVKKFVK